MGKVLMPLPVNLDVDEFAQEVAGNIHGRDFGSIYVADVQMLSFNTLVVTMSDNSQFEIVCRKKVT